jgi:hypothetical protein
LSVFLEEATLLGRLEKILDDAVEEIEQSRPAWHQSAKEAMELWLDQIQRSLAAQYSDLSPLVGPTYGVGALIQSFRRTGPDHRTDAWDMSRLTPPEPISSRFQGRLQWLEDRVNNRLLRENLPETYRERLERALDTQRAFADLGERFYDTLSLHLARPNRSSFWGFRLRQTATYSILLLLLVFALGGADAWEGVLRETSWHSLLDLFFSGVSTLFAGKGLAALGSYAFLNIFFGFYYYRRYRRLVSRATRKKVAGLAETLRSVWEEEFTLAVRRLMGFKEEIQSRRAAIASLQGDH